MPLIVNEIYNLRVLTHVLTSPPCFIYFFQRHPYRRHNGLYWTWPLTHDLLHKLGNHFTFYLMHYDWFSFFLPFCHNPFHELTQPLFRPVLLFLYLSVFLIVCWLLMFCFLLKVGSASCTAFIHVCYNISCFCSVTSAIPLSFHWGFFPSWITDSSYLDNI